jgi:hypothetical protein
VKGTSKFHPKKFQLLVIFCFTGVALSVETESEAHLICQFSETVQPREGKERVGIQVCLFLPRKAFYGCFWCFLSERQRKVSQWRQFVFRHSETKSFSEAGSIQAIHFVSGWWNIMAFHPDERLIFLPHADRSL